jgi:hypothetical protein
LWVSVQLRAPDPDVNARVRQLLPNAVRVEAAFAERTLFDPPVAAARSQTADPVELYTAFVRRDRGDQALEPELIEAFREQYAHAAAHE